MDITKEIIDTLRYRSAGRGHYEVSIDLEDEEMVVLINDSHIIDVAFDDCYDDEDQSNSFYESRLQAQESLVECVLRYHDIAY
jgi:hypothetical protein